MSASTDTTRRRVKLYQLRTDSEWDDQGTGHVHSQHSNDLLLEVRSEAGGRVMLESNVSRSSGYERQGENLILWEEPDGKYLALSFQEEEGCTEIWHQICEEKKQPTTVSRIESAEVPVMEEEEVEVPELPEPTRANLPEYLKVLNSVLDARKPGSLAEGRSRFAIMRAYELLGTTVHKQGHIPILLAHLEVCEDLEDLDTLYILRDIIMALLFTCDHALLEVFFSEEHVKNMFGALEYEQNQPKKDYRKFLFDEAKLHEVIPLPNEELKYKIKQTYYLTYLKDVVLAGVVDDYLPQVIDSFVTFAGHSCLQLVQKESSYLTELLQLHKKTDNETDPRRQQAKFLKEFVALASPLQTSPRQELLKTLFNNGVVQTCIACLELDSADILSEIGGALVKAMELEASLVRKCIVLDDSDVEDNVAVDLAEPALNTSGWQLIRHVVEAFLKTESIPVVSLLAQFLNLFMDSETFDESDATFKSKFLTTFYSARGPFERLMTAYDDVNKQRDSAAGEERLLLTTDFIAKWARMHSYHSKNFILRNDVLGRAARIMAPGSNNLLMTSGIRMLGLIIQMNNPHYQKKIISENLLKPAMKAFELNGNSNNLLNSSVLSILAYIKQEKQRMLIDHLVSNYRPQLEAIDYAAIGQDLVLKYEQSHDRTVSVEDSDQIVSAVEQRERHKRDGSMDRQEEDYFESSDDPQPEPAPTEAEPVPKPVQQGPPPRPRGIVPYDDDEDDDIPVFRPAAKRSKPMKIMLKTSK